MNEWMNEIINLLDNCRLFGNAFCSLIYNPPIKILFGSIWKF